MIQMKMVEKNYGSAGILKKINLELMPREQCVVWGKSGSGKSSLLYLLGGLERPSAGEIFVDGKALHLYSEDGLAHYRRDYIGFIFQFHFLLPTLTCWENILLPLKLHSQQRQGKELAAREQQAREWCSQLELDSLLKKYPYQVSGGEQQRFSLLRALITGPKIILCDEPTGNLDSQNAVKVMDLLQHFASSFGSTLVVVTHDQDMAQRFNRKIIIEDGCLFG